MNKIAILLPYKEMYSKQNAGAASLYVNELLKYSKFKNIIKIYGVKTKGFPLTKNYKEISTRGKSFSKTKNYLDSFVKTFVNEYPGIIEIHNRPNYLNYLTKRLKSLFITVFHNDPLLMSGSKSKKERMEVIKNSSKIIFISKFIKNQFFKDLDESKYLNKYEII